MNDQKQVHITSDWINHIHSKLADQKGCYQAYDNNNNQILLEWEKVNPISSRLNDIIKETSTFLVPTYVLMELECARQHPEAVNSDMFLKRLAPLFKNGVNNVNWAAAEQILTTHMQEFFTTTDFTQYSGDNDIQIFVNAKDKKSGTQLGVIQFIITPQFENGTVKVAFFGIAPAVEDSGIQKLLLSIIFKLIPDVTRIFLHTRITNEKALSLYQDLNFTKFEGPLPLWADREYLIQNSTILQNICNTIETL